MKNKNLLKWLVLGAFFLLIFAVGIKIGTGSQEHPNYVFENGEDSG